LRGRLSRSTPFPYTPRSRSWPQRRCWSAANRAIASGVLSSIPVVSLPPTEAAKACERAPTSNATRPYSMFVLLLDAGRMLPGSPTPHMSRHTLVTRAQGPVTLSVLANGAGGRAAAEVSPAPAAGSARLPRENPTTRPPGQAGITYKERTRPFLRGEADRAADAGAAQAAVAGGILRQVLLVLVLGVVEGRRGEADVGADRAVPGVAQPRLVGVAAGQRQRVLVGVVAEDHRTVLGAHVVALAHALGRVVVLPEGLEQGLERHGGRLVDHQHHLGMAGLPGAHLAIGRVRSFAAGVTRGGGHHARERPELALHAP